ncbi:MAG: alpha/beta fold hydrolase [Acidobacteriota bacterium]
MKRVKINNVEIAYRDEGAGKPVVFLHAFPMNQTMWDEQVRALSPYYRAITLDWRGFGESEIGSVGSTMSVFANDLAGLLDRLQIEHAAICGLSMGGYVAFDFFRSHPDRVNALILCDTRATADTEEAKRRRYEMAELARSKGTAEIAEQMIPQLLGDTTLQSRPDVATRIRAMIETSQAEGIAQALMGMAQREDSTDLLPLVKCPTLVIVGSEDKLTPQSDAEKMLLLIKNAGLEVIDSTGHLSNIECPAIFNKAVLKFLNRL